MILFPLQEAELLDRYSVLLIKLEHGLNVGAEVQAFMECVEFRLNEAIASLEFKNLLLVNRNIFDLVEKARRDECRASDVALANDARHAAKVVIQKRWFNTQLVERKTGVSNE